MQIDKLLASRTDKMSTSSIREILKVVSQSGMVSLAGGIPAPESFPTKLMPMLQSLEKYFPDDFKWSKPEGGMFLWAEGPKGFDAEDLYHRCVRKDVAFVPGKYFFTDPRKGLETMRLNFTMADEKKIDESIEIIAEEGSSLLLTLSGRKQRNA